MMKLFCLYRFRAISILEVENEIHETVLRLSIEHGAGNVIHQRCCFLKSFVDEDQTVYIVREVHPTTGGVRVDDRSTWLLQLFTHEPQLVQDFVSKLNFPRPVKLNQPGLLDSLVRIIFAISMKYSLNVSSGFCLSARQVEVEPKSMMELYVTPFWRKSERTNMSNEKHIK